MPWAVTVMVTTSWAGHETLVGTIIGEVLQIDPDDPRCGPDTLACLPSNSPDSRMAIMLGGAAFHAAQGEASSRGSRRTVRLRRAERDVPSGTASDNAGHALNWAELVTSRIATITSAAGYGAASRPHVMQVPTGSKLPENGRVQMYRVLL